MRENLRFAVGKYQCQFVGESFTIVEGLRSIFFLFFPMIDELDRPSVHDVPFFVLAKNSVEHSCRKEQTDVGAIGVLKDGQAYTYNYEMTDKSVQRQPTSDPDARH